MLFIKYKLRDVKRASTVERVCENCGNIGEWSLKWQKAGLGIGMPVVSLFTEKAMLTTHKNYYLQCPICSGCVEVDKNVAKGMKLEGKRS